MEPHLLTVQLGFVIPLAAQPDQCFDTITPHSMHTSKVCGASGAFLLLGGWCGVMWSFLRSFSLHLQICWQVLVGRNFMIFAQVAGWGVPILGIILALVFSGVSFRFGATCHINHKNSLADLWIPLLIFAGATVIITFATFGYCVKVYLASLSDTSASTEGSSLPTYSNSVRTMTPRQAYRRVKRVIALQWRGLAIVLIIIADVIFFSIVFVFQDNIVQSATTDPKVAKNWVTCLIGAAGDKNQCLNEAKSLIVNEATIAAVLLLLAVSHMRPDSVITYRHANSLQAERHMAHLPPGPIHDGHGLDRVDPVPVRHPKEGVCIGRCPVRSEERYTFVRDALKRFQRCGNTALSSEIAADRAKNAGLLWTDSPIPHPCAVVFEPPAPEAGRVGFTANVRASRPSQRLRGHEPTGHEPHIDARSDDG